MISKRTVFGIALAVLACLLLTSVVVANGFELSWWTADGGGGESSGGGYALRGTAGQCDAGTMTGGTYALSGGFWGGPALRRYPLRLPLVFR
jgi:hypothetical protein